MLLKCQAEGGGSRRDASGVWAPVTGDPLSTFPAAFLVVGQLAAAQDVVKRESVRCGSFLYVCMGWGQARCLCLEGVPRGALSP